MLSMTAFVPCRAGSRRVKNKNTRSFFGEESLLSIKLKQLDDARCFTSIILSTNDEAVINIAMQLDLHTEIKIDKRPDEFCSSTATTDDLIEYCHQNLSFEHLVWTHVTSPFFDEKDYEELCKRYNQIMLTCSHDSVVSARTINSFTFDENFNILNYEGTRNWPFTQDLKTLYEIDSAAFVISHEKMIQCNNRMGANPFVYQTNSLNSLDIDHVEDFTLAQSIFGKLNGASD